MSATASSAPCAIFWPKAPSEPVSDITLPIVVVQAAMADWAANANRPVERSRRVVCVI